MSAALQFWGAGVFSDPNGAEWVVWATTGGAFRWRQGTPPIRIRLHGAIMDRPVSFTQAFDRLIMFRGAFLPELELGSLPDGFHRVDTAERGDGTQPIPFADRGALFKNRLLIPHGRDLLSVSDVLDYTRYAPVNETFRINQGEADQIQAALPLSAQTVLIAKRHSVYLVSHVVADANGDFLDAQCDPLAKEWGIPAPRSLVRCVNDALALSDRGVVSFRFNEQMQLQGVDLPLSAPLEAVMARLNWAAAAKAAAAYWDNRYYLAVPLDGSTHNNAVLVYDFFQQAWAGYDEGVAVDVAEFVKTIYNGRERLFFFDRAGYLNLYEEGLEDELGYNPSGGSSSSSSSSSVPTAGQCLGIQSECRTRGYGGQTAGVKRFNRVTVSLRTWAPYYSLTAENDGPGRVSALRAGVTRNRARYDVHGQADYDTTNIHADAELPRRRDRSVVIKTESAGLYLGAQGLALETMEPVTEQRRCKRSGRTLQVGLANTLGRFELLSSEAAWQAGPRREGGVT